MTLSAVRVAMARESLDELALTPEEELIVAPPDVAGADPEVAQMTQDDAADDLGSSTIQLLDDSAAVAGIIEDVRGAGEDITPQAVAIAQERLALIGRRYGLNMRKKSRESADASVAPDAPEAKDIVAQEPAGPFSDAQDLIADAEKNLEFIKVAANEGLMTIAQRAATNAQNFFKWRTTYVKDVRGVGQAAAKTKGAPVEGRLYTNKARIAHITTGDKKVLTTAKDFAAAFATSTTAMAACRTLQEQMEGTLVFLFQASGRVNLDAINRAFQPSTYAGADGGLSVTGSAAIFGEELIMKGFRAVGQTANKEELLLAFADVRFQRVQHWTVGDLEIEGLPAMAAKDVAANCAALVGLASGLKVDYDINGQLRDTFNDRPDLWRELIRLASNPKLYVKFRLTIGRMISAMAAAGDMNVDLKSKALNCLLDYYKFSLKNHSAETAGE